MDYSDLRGHINTSETMDPGNVTAAHNVSLSNLLQRNKSNCAMAFLAYVEPMKNIMLVVYLTTMVVGLIGNTITIAAIITTKQTRSMANCFILNLAIADDLFVCSLPFQAHSSYTNTWVFGDIMCHVLNPFYEFNLFASIFTMVLMSIDRYVVVKHPLRSRDFRTTKNAIIVCVLVWVTSFIIVTPTWLFAKVTRQSCILNMAGPRATFWKYFELILGFILPILIMVVCYSRLVCNLRQDSRSLVQNQSPRPIKKVTVMVIIVTAVFIICWTPYHTVRLIDLRSKSLEELCRLQLPWNIANLVAQALVFASSCCNPFIYWLTSKKFRGMYSVALRRCCPRLCKDIGASMRHDNTLRSTIINSSLTNINIPLNRVDKSPKGCNSSNHSPSNPLL